MARCDSGYFCIECEVYVESILDSELYLRYILGEVPLDALLTLPDRHLRCNPEIAQYIVDPDFEPIADERPEFDKRRRDSEEVAAREELVTRAWRRQQQIPRLGLDVAEYPLPGLVAPTMEAFFGVAGDEEASAADPEGRIFF